MNRVTPRALDPDDVECDTQLRRPNSLGAFEAESCGTHFSTTSRKRREFKPVRLVAAQQARGLVPPSGSPGGRVWTPVGRAKARDFHADPPLVLGNETEKLKETAYYKLEVL